jgi:hypothetical protein
MSTCGQKLSTKDGALESAFKEPKLESSTNGIAEAAIIWLCDLNPKSLGRVRNTCRVVGVSNNPADILNAPIADAIALVVPASHPFHL